MTRSDEQNYNHWDWDGSNYKGTIETKDVGDRMWMYPDVDYVLQYTVKRTGNEYEVTGYNYTRGVKLFTYTLKNSSFSEDVKVKIKGVQGSVRVYEGAPDALGFTEGKDANGGGARHGVNRDRWVNTNPMSDEEIQAALPDPGTYKVKELSTQGKASQGTYADYFLKEDIQTVKIDIDPDNLDYILQNGGGKPSTYAKSVTIGDKKVEHVGLKTKGNYTLWKTYTSSTSDRFSFTVNFGKYIKKKNGYDDKQNFYGVGKISFNNFFFDKTMMKEYTSWKLMNEMGVPSSMCGLAKLYINGKYYGIYSMIESMDTSIIKRYQKSTKAGDMLTKVAWGQIEYQDWMSDYKDSTGAFTLDSISNRKYDSTGKKLVENGRNVDNCLIWMDGDGNWQWNEGNTGNLPVFWKNDRDTFQDVAEALPTTMTWLEKITNLSNGKDFSGNTLNVNSDKYIELLEQVLDVDAAVRYYATHSYLVQTDYLFSSDFYLGQNAALYVSDEGKAIYIPWDYDLAWGTMDRLGSQRMANYDRDKMYGDTSVSADSRYNNHPIIKVIWQNSTLKKRYYTYMDDCAKITVLGGTTTAGTTNGGKQGGVSYAPAQFSEELDAMQKKLEAAPSSSDLAENCTYMESSDYDSGEVIGSLAQPAVLKKGIPNLKKGIAMRAVGVWLQSHSKDYSGYVVTGDGAYFGTIGHGQDNEWEMSRSGKLAVADADTGSFVTGNFNDSSTVLLTSKKVTDSNLQAIKKAAKNALGTEGEAKVAAISLSCTGKIGNGGYTLHFAAPKELAEGATLYSYSSSGALTKINAKVDGSVYIANVGTTLGTFVLAKEEVTEPDSTKEPDETKQPTETPAGDSPTPVPGGNSGTATNTPAPTETPASTQTAPASGTGSTDTSNKGDAGTTAATKSKKTIKLSSVKVKKGAKQITGKISVKGTKVKVKVGSKAYKKATVKGKKFTFKVSKKLMKKKTKIKIRVTKNGYKTLTKTYKVK